MKRSLFALSLCVLFLAATSGYAQQIDAAFGVSTITGPAASAATGNYAPQTIGGGAYPAFSGDFLFLKHFGIGGEILWRAHQNVYAGFQPFRPIFYSVNGVYAPPLGKRAALELQGGIGAESLRFYNNFYTCNSFTGCTTYTSSNHFMGHLGGGIRLYPTGNFFIRPEAHVYFVRNNFEFSGPRVTRFGVSIGYSWRSE